MRSFVFLFIFLSGLPLWPQDGGASEKSLASLGVKLGEVSAPEDLDAIARAAEEQRRLFIGRLATLLKTSASMDAKIRACYLLGEFRAVEVVDVIADHLDMVAPSKGAGEKGPRWSHYPCIGALALIGKPGERPLIGAISRGQPGVQDFAISALVSIEGKKGAQAQLAEALKSSDGEAAVKIKAVLGLLKSQAPDEGQDDTLELVRLLREARSAKEMDELTNSLVGRQYELWYSLADILRSTVLPEKKARACFLLGEFGAYRELSEMIGNIGLKVENRGELDKIPLWRQYPCQEAIARLGKPAEQGLIQLLVDTEKDDIQELVIQTFVYIEAGRDGAELTLRKAIMQAPQGQVGKLEKALDKLKR